MSYIKNSSTTASIYAIKYEEPQPRFNRPDRVDERDAVGTGRTMITRLGFGSSELTFTAWLVPSEWEKLNTMRGTVVEYEGATYDLTVPSVAQYDARLYEIQIRLKKVVSE
jgi:hypothetical protein